MSSGEMPPAPAAVTVKDLVEEAKKRIVFLIVCLFGLSYLMSVTSSSVLVNVPAAAVMIVAFRYFSLDFEMRRKAATYKSKASAVITSSPKKPSENPAVVVEKSDWRQKVNSPIVEEAIDTFTRHMVSEWVTDLWYSRITTDRQGPEELVQIMNGVLGEISGRMKNVNLIDLLTRDIINLLCSHLELFRATKAKIKIQHSRFLTVAELDKELKYVLYSENKLHPSLFSTDAEHKVLQHIVGGLIPLTFKPNDLQCSAFVAVVRELVACVVMRPVLNLASPRFINERIESLVMSLRKNEKEEEVDSHPTSNGSVELSPDHCSHFIDPSSKGVELVQLKKDQAVENADKHDTGNLNGSFVSKDPLLSMDTCSTRSWSALPSDSQIGEGKGIQRHRSGGEWGEMLDALSRRKTEALAPEHFENMWAKGRNYKRSEETNPSSGRVPDSNVRISRSGEQSNKFSERREGGVHKVDGFNKGISSNQISSQSVGPHSYGDEYDNDVIHSDKTPSISSSSYTTEDEENSAVTGLDSPGVMVWDAKSRRNVAHIHHPLETKKAWKKNRHSHRLTKTLSKKRSGAVKEKAHVWQEIERTSFLSGDGQDILNTSMGNIKHEDSGDDSGGEKFAGISSGSNASSFMSSTSLPENYSLTANPTKNSILASSFLTLGCEVLGANIVKSGSKTFAVYSISVVDVNGHSWSIKRRFRHFEELHQHLKEFPEYNLHLPPKHFLSTGLDIPVIQERCKLLDKYLKTLMQLPNVSSSIDVWDFLSVDSQTYSFSNPLSIMETLSVNIDGTMLEKGKNIQNSVGSVRYPVSSRKENSYGGIEEPVLRTKNDAHLEGSRVNSRNVAPPPKKPVGVLRKLSEDRSSDSDDAMQNVTSNKNLIKASNKGELGLNASSESHTDIATLPSEWVPPNLSLPILNLVDVVFHVQDGGWLRSKAFWVAKQVLHLGMGDAFDDWVIEKIQFLRRGSIVASGIRRLEQILWPDGIFITKHPRRQRATPSASPSSHGQPPTPLSSPKMDNGQMVDDMQEKEALRRAKLVYDLMIDKAPPAVVSLVGRKEYEQCAKELYFFIQSTVVMKQLAYDLLELVFLSAFPEVEDVFRGLHEEKERFGELRSA